MISLFLGTIIVAEASAQNTQDKWDRLATLAQGTRLVVDADGGRTLKGKLVRIGDRSITVRSNGRDVEVTQESVSAVYYGKRTSRLKQALIGGLAGIGAGFLIGGVAAAGGADPLAAAAGVLYGLPAGAAIGAATGGKLKKGDLIYSR